MAGWDTDDGTSVTATERLRAKWALRPRPTVTTNREPAPAESDDDAHEPPERAN